MRQTKCKDIHDAAVSGTWQVPGQARAHVGDGSQGAGLGAWAGGRAQRLVDGACACCSHAMCPEVFLAVWLACCLLH